MQLRHDITILWDRLIKFVDGAFTCSDRAADSPDLESFAGAIRALRYSVPNVAINGCCILSQKHRRGAIRLDPWTGPKDSLHLRIQEHLIHKLKNQVPAPIIDNLFFSFRGGGVVVMLMGSVQLESNLRDHTMIGRSGRRRPLFER
jgi:hypothetical protein